MSTTMHELGSVAEVFNGKTPSKSEQRDLGHPVLKIKDVTEDGNFKGKFESFVEDKLISKLKRKLVAAGDILILNAAHNADYVGSKIYRAEESVIGSLATGEWLVVRPDVASFNPGFVYYWIINSQTKKEMRELVKGIHLYPKDVERLRIPLFPLSEQNRIAAILEKADAIRRKRQETVRLTEELIRSAFLEMFGDPVTNPKGWLERILVEVSDIRSGVTKGKKLDGKLTVSVPYMRVANVQDGHINLDEIKEIEVTPADAERYALHPGDVLLTEGGDPDKLGRGAVWRGQIEPCIHQNHIFRVRPNTNLVLPEFLSILIGSARGKKYFLRAAKQTTGIASINKTQLSNFPVLLPPLQLQQQFVALVKRQETLQQNLAMESKLQNDLFNSLIQRAFRGELTAHDKSTDTCKVVPLKSVKKEGKESTSAEAKRHAGHDIYNKAALAAYIVSRCHNPAEPMGRVKLAKLFYLVQRKVDLALTETFTRRAAGPLDDAIFKFLPFAQKNNWLVLLPQVGMKKPVGPGGACEDAVKQTIKYLGEKRSAVDEVLDSLKYMKGHTLECWATVDAIAEELSTSGKSLTVRNILQTLAASPEWRLKLDKLAFSELNIASALLGLQKLGFIR